MLTTIPPTPHGPDGAHTPAPDRRLRQRGSLSLARPSLPDAARLPVALGRPPPRPNDTTRPGPPSCHLGLPAGPCPRTAAAAAAPTRRPSAPGPRGPGQGGPRDRVASSSPRPGRKEARPADPRTEQARRGEPGFPGGEGRLDAWGRPGPRIPEG